MFVSTKNIPVLFLSIPFFRSLAALPPSLVTDAIYLLRSVSTFHVKLEFT